MTVDAKALVKYLREKACPNQNTVAPWDSQLAHDLNLTVEEGAAIRALWRSYTLAKAIDLFLPKTAEWMRSLHSPPLRTHVRLTAIDELAGFSGVENSGRTWWLNAGDLYTPTLATKDGLRLRVVTEADLREMGWLKGDAP